MHDGDPQANAPFRNMLDSTPRAAGDLARYLCFARKAGVDVDFHKIDKKLWGLALEDLIYHHPLDVATFAAPQIARAFPEAAYFQTMMAVLAGLPPQSDDASFAAFRDDSALEVQIVPRVGARAALIGFCGRAQKMGMPLNLIHRWFGRLGVHVIYLRDYQSTTYDNGIRSLATDLTGTLRALREIIADLGVKRLVCYGNSLGSYGALRYALELHAEAVLAFAGPTTLDPGFKDFSLLAQRRVAPGLDLRPLYHTASHAPRAHIVFGELHAFDRAHAINFAGLPTVSLEMAPGCKSHEVFLYALFNGRYERLVQWLVDPHRGSRPP